MEHKSKLPGYVMNLENVTVLPRNITPTKNIKFMRVAVYSENFVHINDNNIAVDSLDRVYIADGGPFGGDMVINIYNANGKYIGKTGRIGKGPGEFIIISSITLHSMKIYAYDEILKRISIFSLKSLDLIKVINLDPSNWNDIKGLPISRINKVFPITDSEMLVEFQSSFGILDSSGRQVPVKNPLKRYLKMDMKGNTSQKVIFQYKYVPFAHYGIFFLQEVHTTPFDRSSLFSVSKNGEMYYAWTEHFLIKVYNADGSYAHAFYVPYTNSKINLNRFNDEQLNDIDNGEIPETWPAIDRMLTDDKGRIWVATITDELNYYTWWVISKEGELIATFKWPGNKIKRYSEKKEIRLIKNGYLYSYETTDKQHKIKNLVKYRIILEPLVK